MKLTVGMLRGIIKEEVTKVRRARLREMGGEALGPRSLSVRAGGGSPSMSGMSLDEAIDDFISQTDISLEQDPIDVAQGFFSMYSKSEIDKWCEDNRLSRSSILSMVAGRL